MAELDPGFAFLPVGAFPAAVAKELVTRISRRVAVPCRLLSTAEGLEVVRLEGRRQLSADDLLEALEARAPPEGAVLVGLTLQDIGSPLFTHFFGRARLHGRAALVSLARLQQEFYGLPPDAELTLRRAAHEILHELGHVGGLVHCHDARCVMHFAANVEAIDLRGAGYCAPCAERLPPALRPRRPGVRPPSGSPARR